MPRNSLVARGDERSGYRYLHVAVCVRNRIPDAHFEALAAFAAAHGGPPRSFLGYRRRELEMALDLACIDVRGKTVVEIGGGVSGQAYHLTWLADRVVSTDLLNIESVHGGDFTQAAAIRAIAANSLFFVCARGEQLPLADMTADIVFSSYVFEHIGDRQAAAREARRILRPKGYAIILVPNVMEAGLRALWFVGVYAPRQLLKLLLLRTGIAGLAGIRFKYPPDLRYRPHGVYAGHVAEFAGSRIGVWDDIFKDAGFEIVRRFSLRHEAYFAFFSASLTSALQRRVMGAIRRIGARSPAVWLGPTYGFVARRLD